MFQNFLLVGLGGFLGSIARYSVSLLLKNYNFLNFPLGTFSVNIAGSLLIGFIISIWGIKTDYNAGLKLFLSVGICGGFTTFSSFTAENFKLIEQKLYLLSFVYISMSVILGIAAIFAGGFFAKKIF